MARGVSFAVFLATIFLLSPAPAAAQVPFVRGDSNADGTVDLSDAIQPLFCVFLGMDCDSRCLAAGDADGNGDRELTDSIYLLSFLFLGGPPPAQPYPWCGVESLDHELGCRAYDHCPPDSRDVAVVGSSGCLRGGGGGATVQECAEFSFAGGTLTIHHRNAALNCCATAVADLAGDATTIVIREKETYEVGPCRCECLFDLDIQVSGLGPGPYLIRITVRGDLDPERTALEFPVDLGREPGGSYCEDRTGYPWGG